MPFARPTLSQLRTQVLSDITSSDLPGADGLLRKAVLRVLGLVQAGLAYLHFGYLDWISKQSVPFTASEEYAEAWGALVGVTRLPAVAATGSVTATGTVGAVIPSGSGVQRGDAFAYTTTALATIPAGGTVNIPVVASSVGVTGNADAGTLATFTGAVVGVVSGCTLVASDGTDAELDDPLRDRYLFQFRNPPHGGDISDYVEWALAIPGVTRAWCAPRQMGVGTVTVYTMFDANPDGGFPVGTNGVATAESRDVAATGDLLTVANAIYPLRPVTALVYSSAPAPHSLAFVINDLVLPYGAAPNILSALQDVLLRKADPLGGKIAPSDFEGAIAAVPGVTSFSLAQPSTPVSAPLGSLLTVGTVSYGVSA